MHGIIIIIIINRIVNVKIEMYTYYILYKLK